MNKRCFIMFTVLIILWVFALSVNLFAGSADISPSEVIKSIFMGSKDTALNIMWKIRIPRVLGAMLLGGALALSGYLLQTFFHNPIAGPFVLGVSSGAKLLVAVVMIISAGNYIILNSAMLVGAAFIGSMLSLGIILLISQKVRGISMLVVCGVMIGYICTAVTDFLVVFANDSDIINLRSWSMGSFSGMSMDNVFVSAVVVLSGLILTFWLSKPISAYRMGEAYAASLGVKVSLLRTALILLSGLLSACVTAYAGPVSFVGIAVPHIIRLMLKTSKPILIIPACFLGGGIFCMICDMIARTAFSPNELSISTVTAIFGAPVVIAIMIRRRRGEV